MSYARFGWENSSVYLFAAGPEHPPWLVECCGCNLNDGHWSGTGTEALSHLRDHQAVGHTVPAETFAEIEADRAEGLLT